MLGLAGCPVDFRASHYYITCTKGNGAGQQPPTRHTSSPLRGYSISYSLLSSCISLLHCLTNQKKEEREEKKSLDLEVSWAIECSRRSGRDGRSMTFLQQTKSTWHLLLVISALQEKKTPSTFRQLFSRLKPTHASLPCRESQSIHLRSTTIHFTCRHSCSGAELAQNSS